MQKIRIIEIPKMKAVYSGALTDEATFAAFNNWFSQYHDSLKNELYPRDFMQFNERIGAREWFYALPQDTDADSIDGFSVVDLPHRLYAVAPCLDADLDEAQDWLKTRSELIEWAAENEKFKLYENAEGKPERYPLFHIVSPGRLYADGVSIEDMYIPIEER